MIRHRAGERKLRTVALRGASGIVADVKKAGGDPVAVVEAVLALPLDVDVATIAPELRPVLVGLRTLRVVLRLDQPLELVEVATANALRMAARAVP